MRLFTMAMMSLLAVSAYAKGDSSQSSSTKDRYSTQATLSQGGLRRTTNTPLFPLRGSPTTMPKKMGRSKPGAGKAKRKPKLTMAELENELQIYMVNCVIMVTSLRITRRLSMNARLHVTRRAPVHVQILS
ncbi:hypothetical protein BASA81_011836 [Batrachochytrium salamandrivorans]|nr:hypothetical protein BASA81_011836 [Batrachochytrium salamandrivorans]